MKGLVGGLLISFSMFYMAHDHNVPELDAWYKSLKNVSGLYCCDGSDVYSVNDPNWEPNPDVEYPYKVKVKYTDGTISDSILVHKAAVVKASNLTGIAKVWPRFDRTGIAILCFLPGSLS
jgi:hypothetical protein